MFKIYIILGLLVAAGTAFFVWDYTSTKAENKRLVVEITAANNTIHMLDAKAEAEAAITETTEGILNEVRNSPESDDGPVAPVLSRALDRM